MHANKINKAKRAAILPVLILAAFALQGCQSGYRDHTKKIMHAYAGGDYITAAEISKDGANKKASKQKDRIAYYLEAGRTAQAAHNIDDSIAYYDAIFEEIRPYLDTKAENTITEGIATTAVNQAQSIYKATPGERILLNTLNALNYIQVGDLDAARIELNRAADWQQDAVRRYAKEIEKAQEEADKAAAENNLEGTSQGVPSYLSSYYTELDDMTAYADFQNPFTSHLRGIFLLSTAADDGDYSNARFDLRMAASTNQNALPAIEPDLTALEGSMRHATEPATWVYFMTGAAPRLTEFRLDIPIPIGDVNYVSAAFPRLEREPNYLPYLDVQTSDGSTARSLPIVSVENIIASEFKTRLPTIITQEIASTVAKAAATYALKEGAGTWGQIVGIIYQAASTSADLRTWRTLPKEVQLVRLPPPADGLLHLTSEGGRNLGSVQVTPNESNLVVVTMPSPLAPTPSITVSQLSGISSVHYQPPVYDEESTEDNEQAEANNQQPNQG